MSEFPNWTEKEKAYFEIAQQRAKAFDDGVNTTAAMRYFLNYHEAEKNQQTREARARQDFFQYLSNRLNEEGELVVFRSLSDMSSERDCSGCSFRSRQFYDWIVVYRLNPEDVAIVTEDKNGLQLSNGLRLLPHGLDQDSKFWRSVTSIHQLAEGHIPPEGLWGLVELINNLYEGPLTDNWLF